mgnify:FL=1
MGHSRTRTKGRAGRYVRKAKHMFSDLDQIQDEIQRDIAEGGLLREFDADLPGGGQFFCIVCSRHFVNDATMQAHFNSKAHRKQLRKAQVPAVTQREVDWASGVGVDQPGARSGGAYEPPVLAGQDLVDAEAVRQERWERKQEKKQRKAQEKSQRQQMQAQQEEGRKRARKSRRKGAGRVVDLHQRSAERNQSQRVGLLFPTGAEIAASLRSATSRSVGSAPVATPPAGGNRSGPHQLVSVAEWLSPAADVVMK